MKERTTFVHGPGDPFDPKQLQLQNDTLTIKSLKAAREDRITLSLYELPQEVSMATVFASRLLLTKVAMAGLETMSRAACTMGVAKAISSQASLPLDRVSWLTRPLHPPKRPFCVCKLGSQLGCTFSWTALITSSDLLCPLLQKIFGSLRRCTSPEVQ